MTTTKAKTPLHMFNFTYRRLANSYNGNPRFCINVVLHDHEHLLRPVIDSKLGFGKYSDVQGGYIVSTYHNIEDYINEVLDNYEGDI